MSAEVVLRRITADDLPFLHRVYASTRTDIVGVPWSDAQKEAFLQMQFQAQHTYYQAQFPAADYLLVERDGKAIGRLYIDRREACIHILDISLLPHAQGEGIGTRLLQELMDEGRQTQRNVTLYVERENSARVLYQRLAFRPVAEQGIYILMEWKWNDLPASM